MTTLTVFGVDPGSTNGWAYYQAEVRMTDVVVKEPLTIESGMHISTNEELLAVAKAQGVDIEYEVEWYNETWQVGQVSTFQELALLVETNHTQLMTLVVERYIQRAGKFGDKNNAALKTIGALEALADYRKIDLVMQMPSQAKGFVHDANIKKLGLWFPGKRHGMDALRHVLFYLIHGPYKRTELLKAWKF